MIFTKEFVKLLELTKDDPDEGIFVYTFTDFVTNTGNAEFYTIVDLTKNIKHIDLLNSIEGTLHRLLDADFSDDEILQLTGLSKEDGKIPIDLGYSLPSEYILCPHEYCYQTW